MVRKRSVESRRVAETEQKKFSLEEGVIEVARQIKILLESKNVVLIAVNSTGVPDLGKTTFFIAISRYLLENGIADGVEDLQRIPQFVTKKDFQGIEGMRFGEFARSHKANSDKKLVGVFSEEGGKVEKDLDGKPTNIREAVDASFKVIAQNIGVEDIGKIDIWVKLDRPDKPGLPNALGDVHIQNAGATDKTNTYKKK